MLRFLILIPVLMLLNACDVVDTTTDPNNPVSSKVRQPWDHGQNAEPTPAPFPTPDPTPLIDALIGLGNQVRVGEWSNKLVKRCDLRDIFKITDDSLVQPPLVMSQLGFKNKSGTSPVYVDGSTFAIALPFNRDHQAFIQKSGGMSLERKEDRCLSSTGSLDEAVYDGVRVVAEWTGFKAVTGSPLGVLGQSKLEFIRSAFRPTSKGAEIVSTKLGLNFDEAQSLIAEDSNSDAIQILIRELGVDEARWFALDRAPVSDAEAFEVRIVIKDQGEIKVDFAANSQIVVHEFMRGGGDDVIKCIQDTVKKEHKSDKFTLAPSVPRLAIACADYSVDFGPAVARSHVMRSLLPKIFEGVETDFLRDFGGWEKIAEAAALDAIDQGQQITEIAHASLFRAYNENYRALKRAGVQRLANPRPLYLNSFIFAEKGLILTPEDAAAWVRKAATPDSKSF